MNFRGLWILVLCLVSTSCRAQPEHPGRTPGIEAYPAARDLHVFAERYRDRHDLPALGVGIVHRDRIVGLGMAGERAAGTGDWARIDDTFDVASCAKPVTATIAAMLVERGSIRWDTTLDEVFPELRDRMRAEYRSVTLDLLLRHRAGLDQELNRNTVWSGWQRQHAALSPTDQRLAFVAAAVARPLRARPDTDTFYSSDGYVIAGSMLERAAGIDWEHLARSRIFEPLALSSFRYGVGRNPDTGPPVSGHEPGWFGSNVVAPDPVEYGAQPFGAPAGFLYASVPDMLGFVGFHMRGSNAGSALLGQASFQRRHERRGDEPFALGWESEVTRDAGGVLVERSIHHSGYSGRFRTNVWFSPESQWGTVIVLNDGKGDDESITADIFRGLLREFRLLPSEPARD